MHVLLLAVAPLHDNQTQHVNQHHHPALEPTQDTSTHSSGADGDVACNDAGDVFGDDACDADGGVCSRAPVCDVWRCGGVPGNAVSDIFDGIAGCLGNECELERGLVAGAGGLWLARENSPSFVGAFSLSGYPWGNVDGKEDNRLLRLVVKPDFFWFSDCRGRGAADRERGRNRSGEECLGEIRSDT